MTKYNAGFEPKYNFRMSYPTWYIYGPVTPEEVVYKKKNFTVTLNLVDNTDTFIKISYEDKISPLVNIHKELNSFLRVMKIKDNYKGKYINEYKDIQHLTKTMTWTVSVLIKDCLPLDIVRVKHTLLNTDSKEEENTEYGVMTKKVYKKQSISLITYKGNSKITTVFSLNGVDLYVSRDIGQTWTIEKVVYNGLPTETKNKALENLLTVFTIRGKLWADVSEEVMCKCGHIIKPFQEKEKPVFTLVTRIKYGNRLMKHIPSFYSPIN